MSNVQQKRTPENTPRDLEEISLLGHYAHTGLVSQIEAAGVQVFNNKEEKDAFLRANNNARGEIVFQALQAYDAAMGGTKAPATRQPVTQRQAAPAQQAAPAAAARAPVTSQQRAPVNGNGNGNGGAGHAPATGYGLAGAQQPAPQGEQPSASRLLLDMMEMLKTLTARQEAVEQALGAVSSDITSVLKTLSIHTKATELMTDLLNNQGSVISASWDVQRANLGLLSLFGQQVLQAPKEDFLGDAMQASDEACEFLAQMTQAAEGKEG